MAIWMEIRCEKRDSVIGRRCLSDNNEGPMDMANDTRRDVFALMRHLEQQAKEQGWKKTRAGWVCPNCAKRPNVEFSGQAASPRSSAGTQG